MRQGRLYWFAVLSFVLAIGCAKIEKPILFADKVEEMAGGDEIETPSGKLAFEFTGTPEIIDMGSQDVVVFPGVHVETPSGNYELELTGNALRIIKILFIDINVYIASSYVTDTVGLSKTEPLPDIQRGPVEMLVLSLLMDVSADQIKDALRKALIKNDVDPESAMMRPFFDQFNGSFLAGDYVAIFVYTNPDGDDEVILKTLHWTRGLSSRDLGFNLWKVWFGVPVDANSADMQVALKGG